jgi:DNA-binding protein HU-beta
MPHYLDYQSKWKILGGIMTKAELVKALKEKASLATLAQAEAVHDGLFAILMETLKKGDSVAISGFGSFKVVERKARKGRNPRTGGEIAIRQVRP